LAQAQQLQQATSPGMVHPQLAQAQQLQQGTSPGVVHQQLAQPQQLQQASNPGAVPPWRQQQQTPNVDTHPQLSSVSGTSPAGDTGETAQDADEPQTTALAKLEDKEKQEETQVQGHEGHQSAQPQAAPGMLVGPMASGAVAVSQVAAPQVSAALPQAPVAAPQVTATMPQASSGNAFMGAAGLPTQALQLALPSSMPRPSLLSPAILARPLPAVAPSVNFASLELDINTFLAKWSVDARAEASFRAADPETQAKVMASFAPKDLSRGASIALMGFLKHVRAKVAEEQEARRQAILAAIQLFVETWQLDERAQNLLCSLDPEMMEKAMRDFAPKDISGGASKAFSGFVRALQKRAQESAGIPAPSLALPTSTPLANPSAFAPMALSSQMMRPAPY